MIAIAIEAMEVAVVAFMNNHFNNHIHIHNNTTCNRSCNNGSTNHITTSSKNNMCNPNHNNNDISIQYIILIVISRKARGCEVIIIILTI